MDNGKNKKLRKLLKLKSFDHFGNSVVFKIDGEAKLKTFSGGYLTILLAF